MSRRARWLTVCAMVITLLMAFLVLLYLFGIEQNLLSSNGSAGDVKTALLTTEDSTWSPICRYGSPLQERFDCYPEKGSANSERCLARGCCWSANDSPRCFYPSNYGYELGGMVKHYFDGLEVPLRRLAMPSRYGDDIQQIRIQAEFQTPYRLRVKFYDPDDETRYEVPEPRIHLVMPGPEEPMREKVPMYSVAYNTTSSPFHIKLRRTDTDTVLFDTFVGGLTFANQFLQISAKVASRNVFGLGDNDHSRFKLNLQNRTKFTLFSRDYLLHPDDPPVYGVHPFYLCMENDGKAHGVLLLNSNALEIELQDTPAITFRSLGGLLDFYFFLGPTAEDVVHQYLEAVGYPFMPPYWALGLHTAITEYDSIGQLKELYDELENRDIPRDAIHLGTEFLSNHTMIPSKDPLDVLEIQRIQRAIHDKGQKLTVSFGPGIPSDQPRGKYPMYDFALHMGLCINYTWGEILEGRMWSNSFAYLDYGNPSTVHWLTELTQQNHIPFQYDGVWLEMEAPVNFVDGSTKGCLQDNFNNPPYIPRTLGSTLYKNTLCMDAKQMWGGIHHRHYNLHNLYGLAMAKAYHSAQKSLYRHKRSLTVSGSTFVGSGQYTGHWIPVGSGDWSDLAQTVPRALQYSLYGIPLTGVDACRWEETDEELCLRWLQLGAFLPLFYSSSAYTITSMPYAKEEFMTAVRHLVRRRYELLPYLYTLFHRAHMHGETVLRPLAHQFPRDPDTYDIDTQFLWGPALLVSPVLTKQAEFIKAYVPSGLWYDYYTGETLWSEASWKKFNTSLYGEDSISLLVSSGHIIPTQESANNTLTSRRNPMKLTVALNGEHEAEGELMWDDGESPETQVSGEYVHVKFLAKNGKLSISSHLGKSVFSSDFDNVHITHVRVFGLFTGVPSYVTIDQDFYLSEKQIHWDEQHMVLHLQNILIPLTRRTVIRWFE